MNYNPEPKITYVFYETEKYDIVIGFLPGYLPDVSLSQLHNIKKDFNIDYFNNLYRKISSNNPYTIVSGVIQKGVVSYPIEWGCPENGEPVYIISCTRNPKFSCSAHVYRQAVLHNVEELQKELKQTTVTVTESKVTIHYSFKNNENK